jgi:hypothetical protein
VSCFVCPTGWVGRDILSLMAAWLCRRFRAVGFMEPPVLMWSAGDRHPCGCCVLLSTTTARAAGVLHRLENVDAQQHVLIWNSSRGGGVGESCRGHAPSIVDYARRPASAVVLVARVSRVYRPRDEHSSAERVAVQRGEVRCRLCAILRSWGKMRGRCVYGRRNRTRNGGRIGRALRSIE